MDIDEDTVAVSGLAAASFSGDAKEEFAAGMRIIGKTVFKKFGTRSNMSSNISLLNLDDSLILFLYFFVDTLKSL